MATLADYGRWLAENEDLESTPEYQQVLRVYAEVQAPAAPDLMEAALAAGIAYQPQYGLMELASRGLSRGASRLGSTVTDIIPALGGSLVGADDYARRQMEEARAKEEELQFTNRASYPSFRDVNSVGDAAGFFMEKMGEQVPNIAAMLIPGAGGGALAARGAATAARALPATATAVARKAATDAVAKQVGRGQTVGAFLGSYALNAPEVFQNIYEETGELAPTAGLLAGALGGALDSVLPAYLLKTVTGPVKAGVVETLLKRSGMDNRLARSATAGFLKGTAGEGITEAAQEAISIAAERIIDDNPEVFGSKEFNRILESAVVGAVVGGGISTPAGAVQGLRERGQLVDRARSMQGAREQRLQSEEDVATSTEAFKGQMPLDTRRPPMPEAQEAAPTTWVPDAYVMRLAQQRGLVNPAYPVSAGGVKRLTQPERAAFDALKQEEATKATMQRASQLAAQNERLGVSIDPTADVGSLNPEQRRFYDMAAAERAPKKAQPSLLEGVPNVPLADGVEPAPLTRMPDTDEGMDALLSSIGANKSAKQVLRKLRGFDLTDPSQRETAVTEFQRFANSSTSETNRVALGGLAETVRAQFAAPAQPTQPTASTPPTELQDDLSDSQISEALSAAGAREATQEAEALQAQGALDLDETIATPAATPSAGLTEPTGTTAPTTTAPSAGLSESTETTAPTTTAPSAGLSESTETTAPTTATPTVTAVWANKDVDQPVLVYDEPAQPPGPDGRAYSRVRAPNAEQDSFVPTDEIKGWAPTTTTPSAGLSESTETTAPTTTTPSAGMSEPTETTAPTTTTPRALVIPSAGGPAISDFAESVGLARSSPVVRQVAGKDLSDPVQLDRVIAAVDKGIGNARGKGREANRNALTSWRDQLTQLKAELFPEPTQEPTTAPVNLQVIPLPQEVADFGVELSQLPTRKPTAQEPMTPEEAAATFFRAYDPDMAVRVMVAEGVPSYTETETVPTKQDARNATRWVLENGPPSAGDIVTKYAGEFKQGLSRTQVTAKRRTYQEQVDEALDAVAAAKPKDTTAKVDAKVRNQERASQFPLPKGLNEREGISVKAILQSAAESARALNALTGEGAETAVGGTSPSPQKQELARQVASQRAMFEAMGGKVEELPPGPDVKAESDRITARGTESKWHHAGKLAGSKPLSDKATTALRAGNLQAAVAEVLTGIGTDTQLGKVLTKLVALGLKTKIVVGEVPAEGLAANEQWASQEDAPSRVGREEALRRLYGRLQDIYDWGFSPDEAYDAAVQELAGSEQSLLKALHKEDFLGFDYPHQAIEAIAEDPTAYELPPHLKAAISRLGNKEFYAPRRAGAYDPQTDTITLDPELGLNVYTLTHELVHAAIANVIADPTHRLTKKLERIYASVFPTIDGLYAATNLQEFAAEMVSNPELQALLKVLTPPKGGKKASLWTKLVNWVAELFGFRKGDSALKVIEDMLDISGDVAPAASDVLFASGNLDNSVGKVWSAAQSTTESAKNKLSNMPFKWREFALGAASLNNMSRMFGKVLTGIAKLEKALEQKRGTVDNAVEALNTRVREINKLTRKLAPATIDKANKLFIEMRLAGVDVLGIDKQYKITDLATHNRLAAEFTALHPSLQEAYKLMRGDLKQSLGSFAALIKEQVGGTQGAALAEEFMNLEGVIAYIPFRRQGDYWVEYTDPMTKERVARAYESRREQQMALQSLKDRKVADVRGFMNLDTTSAPKELPPNSFVAKVIDGMRKKKVDQSIIDQVWQQYAEMFPAKSITKQMLRSKNVLGMDEDVTGAYADTQIKWVNKLANMKYNPQIAEALVTIDTEGKANSDDLNIAAAHSNIMRQRDFYMNPHFHFITSMLTQGSYIYMILGSISAAVVNMTGLPFLVAPTLAGRYGLGATSSTMTNAMRMAHTDRWSEGKYKDLFTELNSRGLLKHTLTREALERGRTKGSDFQSAYARTVEFMSIPFQWSEKYARAVTAISAYELAMKGNKDLGVAAMTKEEAIEYAGRMVKNTHTAGMVEVAPRFFQNDIGRVALTFKQIAWQQAAHVGFIMKKAIKGVPLPEGATAEEKAASEVERKVALRQVLGIYGVAFAFLGANGVPFGSAMGSFLQLVNLVSGGVVASLFGMDDDEPFDTGLAAKQLFGEVFDDGLANTLLGIELSDRAAIANDLFFRDAPEDIKEHGLVRTALAMFAGPMLGQALTVERGIDYLKDGHTMRALESFSPVAVRNGIRTMRFIAEDGAMTTDGMPIYDDFTAFDLFKQAIGFTPNELSDTYEQRSAAKRVDTAVLERKQGIQDLYFVGRETNDQELMRDAQRKAREFQRKYPQLIDNDTLNRSYRAKKSAQKEMLNGIRYSKGMREELQRRFELGN